MTIGFQIWARRVLQFLITVQQLSPNANVMSGGMKWSQLSFCSDENLMDEKQTKSTPKEEKLQDS